MSATKEHYHDQIEAAQRKQHKIGWLNIPGYIPQTWNPVIGCSHTSPGCDNCYAEKMAYRLMHMPFTDYYQFVLADNGKEDPEKFYNLPKWNGETHFVKSQIHKPIKWKKHRTIFVCSMGDLFHESVKYEWIEKVMNIIEMSPEHIFIILTKRPERAVEFFKIYEKRPMRCEIANGVKITWPFSNLWFIATAENQEELNRRAPYLFKIPAAKRGISIEPMLGPISMQQYYFSDKDGNYTFKHVPESGRTKWIDLLDWVIVGGETGPKARPMHPDWVRSIRDQCQAANVPFFFKQWGEWICRESGDVPMNKSMFLPEDGIMEVEDFTFDEFRERNVRIMVKVGRKAAGNLLDGKQHHNWPI